MQKDQTYFIQFDDNQPPIKPHNQVNPVQQQHNNLLEGIVLAILFFTLGGIFYYFSTDSAKNGGASCYYLKWACYAFAIFCIVQGCISLLIYTPIVHYLNQQQEEHECLEHLIHFIRIEEFVLTFACFIAMAYCYNLKEKCDELSKVTLIVLAIFAFILGMVVLYAIYVCCHAFNTPNNEATAITVAHKNPEFQPNINANQFNQGSLGYGAQDFGNKVGQDFSNRANQEFGNRFEKDFGNYEHPHSHHKHHLKENNDFGNRFDNFAGQSYGNYGNY